jgi:DNA-binding PucR family transcriptional regulator
MEFGKWIKGRELVVSNGIANGNILETSKMIYLHRNTIKYRIQRIEELTGKNLNETIHRTYFHTGLMILEYLEEE